MGDGFDLVDFEDDPYWPYEEKNDDVTGHPFKRKMPEIPYIQLRRMKINENIKSNRTK